MRLLLSLNCSMTRLASSAILGMLFVLSCRDDSMGNVDAAACQPFAERIVSFDATGTLDIGPFPGNSAVVIAECPQAAIALSGSCTVVNTNGPAENIAVQRFGRLPRLPEEPTVDVWHCWFTNLGTQPVEIKATVDCLVPAR